MRIGGRIDCPMQQDALLNTRRIRLPCTALHGIADEIADKEVGMRRPSPHYRMREVIHARKFRCKCAEKFVSTCIAGQISYFCRPPAEAEMRE